jgi:VanZ family protein
MLSNKKQIRILVSWTAVLCLFILIFTLSSQPAAQSDGLSKKVTKMMIKTVERIAPSGVGDQSVDDLVEKFNHIVRKNAHFFAYLVLGTLMVNLLRRVGIKGFKVFFLALAICILYAISDEVHQLFVPGRGAQVKDVLIDSAGAMVGVGLYAVVLMMRYLLEGNRDIS